MNREQLEAKTVTELRRLARLRGMSGISQLKKAELVDQLEEPEVEAAATTQVRPSMLGSLVQSAGALGLAVSILSLVLIPLLTLRLSRSVRGGLQASSLSAGRLAQTVRSSRASLAQASSGLDEVHRSLMTIDDSLTEMDPLLRSVSDFIGDDLTETIETTRLALISAEQGAEAIDGVLRGLSLLGVRYNPDQPLHESLADTAASLEPLPDSLSEVERALNTSRADLGLVRSDLADVAEEIEALSTSLGSTADSMAGFGDQLQLASERLDAWSGRVPFVALAFGALAMAGALWLICANLALYAVGARWRSRGMGLGVTMETAP